MKRVKRLIKIALLLLICLCVFPQNSNMAVVKAAQTSVKKVSDGKWQKKNQKMYYIVKGKKQKGLIAIGKKTYYFDENGVQRTSWQKIGKKYYYFNVANGADGYMVKSKKINGIKLTKNGAAVITDNNNKKIKALVKATKMVEKITKPTMTKKDKLRKCYDYCVKKIKYRGSPTFNKGNQWDAKYALDMMNKGRGNCYAYGATFAYMANAIGYKECYTISSGGHGWAEVNGKVYDPSWEIADKKHDYFGLSYNLSGKGGRPNYKPNRTYVKKV